MIKKKCRCCGRKYETGYGKGTCSQSCNKVYYAQYRKELKEKEIEIYYKYYGR